MKDPIVDPQRRESDPEPQELEDLTIGGLLAELLARLKQDEAKDE